MLVAASLTVGCGDDGQSGDRYADFGDDVDVLGDGPEGSSSGSSSEGGETGPKLDAGTSTGETAGGCADGGGNGGGGEIEFSNIWIANSPDGTISKIDTLTATEIGRYQVTPQPKYNVLVGPSRTSVSLYGDMAVADRSGGLAKIHARQEDCVDANNNGQIETSTDANPLPYGQDECLAWRIDIPRMPGVYDDRRGPRAVQWTLPDGLETCDFTGAKVWVAFCNEQNNDATVWLVDGDTGVVDVEIPIPGMMCEMMGPYGGGVDIHSNFWFVENDTRKALYMAKYGCEPGPGEDCWEVFDRPDPDMDPYGITVDGADRIWIAGTSGGTARFDPANAGWSVLPGVTGLGLQEDGEGRMWIAAYPWDTQRGVYGIDSDTVTQIDFIDMTPYAPESRGISIDFEGNVWMVDQTSSAYRIDPLTKQFQVYSGLNAPYTYSDMTGWGLKNVTPPAQG
ncbi:MAG: hypothetical protein KC457_21355 [Myxococcales bacterium]|nr:hypothetical protein [Myxococcales bacterium]